MKKVIQIDADGFFVEDVILQDSEKTPTDCVEVEVPQGLFHPKWNGTAWIEGLTQEEIDSIRNRPIPLTNEQILGQSISEKEIDGIKQGRSISDLEIRLLFGGLSI